MKLGNRTVELSGDEVATAIDAYLVARRISVSGSRTITMRGELLYGASIYVDSSGRLVDNRKRRLKHR